MNAAPRIACLETSARVGSVAVARGTRCLDVRTFRTDFNHAIELLPSIKALCEGQGWAPESLDHVYLSIGPGSFTGLRIAVTVARMLAWSAGVATVGVPTLSVIAHNALDLDDPPRHVAVLLDAKRQQVYCASFELLAGRYRHVLPPAVRDPATLCRELQPSCVLLGEGLPYHEPALATAEHAVLPQELWRPRAEWVHQLGWEAAQSGDFDQPQRLLPLYLRLPEAEEVWRKRRAR